MITKDTTSTVNFYVTDIDGLPVTGKASSITATISVNGDTASAISDTISEIDSTNLPGWYRFNHFFSTAGNVFIVFSCSGCIIMPWEEQVVEISTSPAPSASDIATAVWGANVRSLSTLSVTSGGISFDIATSNGVNQAIRVIKDYGDTKWLTASGFATPSDIPTSDISAIKTKTDNLPASPAAVGSAMTLTAAYDAAKTASQLTASDLSGLSTFDPSTDTVLIDATQAAGMTTATGFATSADVSGAVSALETYGDNHWTGGSSGGATAQQIWEYPTRTITASPTDVSGLATASDLSAVASNVAAVKAKTDNLPASPAARGDAMTLTAAYDAAKTASQLTASDLPSDYAKPGDAMTLTSAYNAAKTASQLTAADLSGLSTFDPTTDTVLIDAMQAAGMATATGFATPNDISGAVSDLETYGDNHWTGGGSGGGGATAQQIWEYPTRTITASPTDVSSLATKTDLSNVQTAIIGAMPSTSGLATTQNVTDAKEAIIAEIPTVPDDYAKASDLSGLSTFNAATDKVTLNSTEDATLGAIKTKVDTLNNADLTGIATSSDVSGAQSAIIAAMPTIPDDYAKPSDVPTVAQIQSGLAKTSDLSGLSTLTVNDIPTPPSVEQIQNGLATSANISALQTHGDSYWGISPEGEITVVVDADEIAEAVWNNDERTLTDDISTITAQDVWEYGSRTLTQYGPDISPDEPVGAVYCTPSDVERRWGINNVRQWADLENDGDNAKIQTQIDWAILAASERINSDLAASVYLLPFNPVPYAVRRFAATLAGVELYNTRAVNISRDQSNAEIRTALADYSNWITSVLSNVPIVGATLK